MRHLLHRATLNRLAQQLARSHDQRRVLFEPVVSVLRSSAFSARKKGMVATVFAGSLWTRDRIRSAGYDRHADAVAARERARCPPSLLRGALASDPRDLNIVYTTGRHVADPSEWPAPAEHDHSVVQLASPDGTLHAVPLALWEQRHSSDEVCYIDGAC